MLCVLWGCTSSEKGRRKVAEEKDQPKVVEEVDKDPRVKGGMMSLSDRVKYPDEARRKGVEGRVYVKVIVNADGTLREAKVTLGRGAGTDEEALRVVRDAEFKPARYNGKNVPARKTVWVQFQK